MITIHIDTMHDAVSGLTAVRVTRDPGGALVAQSDPIYPSAEEAESEAMDVIRRAWPDKSPYAVDPSIGV